MDREFSSFPGIDIKVGLPAESLYCKNLCWNFCVAITFRVKMFGTNPEMNRCSRLGIFIGIAEDLHFMLAFKFNFQGIVGNTRNFTFHHVHGWRTNKSCNKQIGRVVIKIQRTADLFNIPVTEDHDFVRHGHRLNLIMGYVNHRRVQLLVKLRQFNTHLHPEFGIQVRKRFIKKKNFGFTNNRPADGDPLALTS